MNQLAINIGKRVLNNRAKKSSRNKSVQNFETAKTAKILFDTSLPDGFTPIKEFSKFLKKQGIKSKVYGIAFQKEIPQEMLLRANFDFITRKEVNWFGKPSGELIDEYYGSDPDILFVISFMDNITVDYLVTLSRAKFKVGCYSERQNDLDLMINTSKGECEVEYLIEQIKHYIQILEPSN